MTQAVSAAEHDARTTLEMMGGDTELMPPWAYVAAAVALFLIGFFGFFCNLLVIVLMCKDKQLWTPMNVILFNLVCSDFSVSILGNPLTLTAALAHNWIFGQSVCILYGFFMALLGITSITTLTVLAFERYMMISKPFRARHLSRESATVLVGAIWIYSLILTTPPLFGWGEYVNEAANISCSVNWESREFNATSYIIFLFAMGLVVPVVVICYSYVNIIRSLKQNTLRTGQVTKKESRVTYMIAAMIVAFLVAWTPYSVLALLIAFGDPHIVSPGLAVVPALVAKSSICYNPIIYVGLNTQFRSAWKRFLGSHPAQFGETSRDVGPNITCLSPPTINQSQNDTTDDPRRDRRLLTLIKKMPKITSRTSKTHRNHKDGGTEMKALTMTKLATGLQKSNCDLETNHLQKSEVLRVSAVVDTTEVADEVIEIEVGHIQLGGV